MIKNPDGTPFKVKGCLQLFNPDAPEHELFNKWDQEAIKMGGSPVYYYEIFHQQQTIDQLYLEDRGRLFSTHPMTLWALYEPTHSQNFMNQFGIDAPQEMIFELNREEVKKTLGHMPKIGSRIHTPHLREDWEIIQLNNAEFRMWGVIRLQIITRKFQTTLSADNGESSKKPPDFKII